MIYTLASKDDLKGISFNCGSEYIDRYFREELLNDDDAVSYCFWANAEKQELVGIASLSCSGIIIRSASSYNITPAVEVKIFAVDERYQHTIFPGADEDAGHWSDYCWYYLMEIVYGITDKHCGAGHIVLYSVPDAVTFYKRHDFKAFAELMAMPSNMVIDGCIPMFLNL